MYSSVLATSDPPSKHQSQLQRTTPLKHVLSGHPTAPRGPHHFRSMALTRGELRPKSGNGGDPGPLEKALKWMALGEGCAKGAQTESDAAGSDSLPHHHQQHSLCLQHNLSSTVI